MADIGPGSRLAGYEILSAIGRGGMGEIWLARQLSIDRDVALKILSPKLVAKDPRFADRFIAEARAAGRLSHPNIIAVHDVGEVECDGETIRYFSMEYVDGDNFRDLIDRDGPCQPETIAAVMTAMADALAYAHGLGMIHRDIKPENIMRSTEGLVKLADFGLAMQVDAEEDVQRDDAGRIKVMGTPLYMSPEQARGRTLDFRSDHYSLGASLYHLLTGRPPYRRPTSREAMRAHVHDPVPDPAEVGDCPEAWRRLCLRLMAKRPEARFPDPESLRQAVAAAAAAPHAMPARRHRHPRRSRRSRSLATLVIGGLLAFATLGLIALSLGERANIPAGAGPPSARPGATAEGAPANEAMRQAEALIADLPEDPTQAIEHLRGPSGLRDPYLGSDSEAAALLQSELDRLQERIDRARRARLAELEDDLERVQRAITYRDLARASSLLEAIEEPRRALAPDQVEAVITALTKARARVSADARRELGEARSHDQIERILERAEPALAERQLKALHRAAETRRDELDRQLSEAQRQRQALHQQIWDHLGERLMRLRADPPRSGVEIAEFKAEVATISGRFGGEDPWTKHCQALIELADQGLHVHRALSDYLLAERPLIRIAGTGQSYHAIGFDSGSGIVELSPPGSRAVTGKAADDPNIPFTELVRDALTAAGVEPIESHLTAFLWLWDHPVADLHLVTDQRQGLRARTLRSIDIDLRPLKEKYRFDRAGTGSDAFIGGPHHHTGSSLRFEPRIRTRFSTEDYERNYRQLLSRLDADHMDHLTWRQTLRIPFTIEVEVATGPESMPFIGIAQDSAHHLVLKRLRENEFVPAHILDAGLELDAAEVIEVPDAETSFTLTIEAGSDGGLSASVDGQPLPGFDDVRLDPVADVRFLIATAYLRNEATGPVDLLRFQAVGRRGTTLTE